MLILTLSSFLILITGILAALFLYFDRFYEPEKINQMVNAINEFTTDFEEKQWSDEQLYSEVSKFMKSQNATLSILPQESVQYATATAAATEPLSAVTTSSSPDFLVLPNRIFSSEISNQIPDFHSIDINLIPSLRIAQKAVPLSSFTPTMNDVKYGTGTATTINGTVVLYPVVMAAGVTASTSIETHEKAGVNYTISTIPYTNYRQVNFSKISTLDNGETKITNVNLSLQSVSEVMTFLIRFFPFLIGAAILLSFVMVAVYAKTISRPIVSITSTANRMANMELGIVSEIKRKDELGALSTSLNTLSTNLKNALDDLVIANEQLKDDYENELKQDKARKEFVANVSHELKTPLGIIKSYSEGIRDGVKVEKKDYYVEVILEEINRMDQMIIEMLELSKFDAGAVTYLKKNIDFKNILDRAVSIFTSKANEKEVTFDILGEFGSVSIDEKKIERVIHNLLGNAVKYCNPNSIITIRGERVKDTLTIYIENECQLFTEEVLSKIWDRFYKADTSHNRDTEGTGLGLAITKSILEGHGSHYGVHTTDLGICFYYSMDAIE
jgi:signal transduction histidine kinase